MRSWSAILCTLVVAALLWSPTAHAQYFGRNKVNYEDFDFKKLETEHFVFHFYPSEEQAVRDAARMAERWYERHTQLFGHTFEAKKPIIFYANDADFQQTNVIQQRISPGTGGFTEPRRERVVMPLSPAYAETNHVLGHELVHSFQYDIALNGSGPQMSPNRLPLWFIEGMAEYFSVGRQDTHTTMWMRDAVLRDAMPSFDALANPREYFPYRYGQAFLAYIGGKYGDQTLSNLYRAGGRGGLDSSMVRLLGVSGDSLAQEWGQATRQAFAPLMQTRTHPDSLGRRVLAEDIDAGETNIAPVLSPDGRYVAFMSSRDVFTFNLFVADAQTGEVIATLDESGTTSHFNALRFLNSAGTWSPDGERLAFVSYEDGDNQITVWNVQEESIERSFKVKGVTSMKNPAWSPDGTKLAFSGTDGGISDLYVLNLDTKDVRQLTNDRYADLQPAWSPDGETLAFTTDRGDTNFRLLDPSMKMNVGLIDVASREIDVREPFGDALHHNPQFSPDGRSLYFLSDQDGFKDVYRMNLETRDRFRVTHLKTGVSGITALSPAMSVARQSGDVMMSVYFDNAYTGVGLPAKAAQGTPVDPTQTASTPRAVPAPDAARPAPDSTASDSKASDSTAPSLALRDTPPSDTTDADTTDADTTDADTTASDTTAADTAATATLPATARLLPNGTPAAAVLPPPTPDDAGLVASQLRDARSGLPASPDFAVENYDPTLTLEGIVPPRVSGSVGGPLGAGVAGGAALQFGTLLGNQRLIVALQARGSFRDIGGGVSYLNQGDQLNYGASLSHQPIIYRVRQYPVLFESGVRLPVQVIRRIQLTRGGVSASYPISPTRRFEFGVGGARYGYGVQIREFGFDEDLSIRELNENLDTQEREGLVPRGFEVPPEQNTRYLANATAAYVRDFSDNGFTGPVRGGRWRLSVTPNVGSKNFVTARADVRRYFYAEPFTFALQALHVGNYGAGDVDAGFDDFGIANEYIGYPYRQGFVRGYNVRDIDVQAECPAIETADGTFGCPVLDRLFGTRSAVARAEVRVPLLGPDPLGLIPFRYLPTTLALFADAGVAWTGDDAPRLVFEQDSQAIDIPVTSAGVAARFNVLGRLILETYYAAPFQRPDKDWEFGLRISPGW